MKKYRLHLTVFIILALLALFINEYRKGTSLGRREIAFSIEDPGMIDEVVITGSEGRVALSRQGSSWTLNSGIEARAQAVEILLQTLNRLRVSSPAPLFKQTEIMEKLAEESVCIEIRKGRRWRTYYAYSEGPGTPTYMIKANSSRPYTMEVVGFGSDVASLFVSDEGYWRTNILFNYNLNNIAEVTVHHRENEAGSFILRKSLNGEFSLYRYPGGDVLKGVNDSLAVRFLANFFYVPYERTADRNERLLIDSLSSAGHDHLIKVTGHDGSVSEVSLHRIVTGSVTGESSPGFDLFRLYALINGKSEMVIVTYQSVDLILRSSSYFTSSRKM